jgi:hypothetical protein
MATRVKILTSQNVITTSAIGSGSDVYSTNVVNTLVSDASNYIWTSGTALSAIRTKYSNVSSGILSVATGFTTSATGNYSTTEGFATKASGLRSHAEGSDTIASGDYSHAEGSANTASGSYTHVGGQNCTVAANYSFIHSNGSVINTGGLNSAILGGFDNTVNTNIVRSVVVGGSSISADKNDYVFVPNLESKGVVTGTSHGTIQQSFNVPTTGSQAWALSVGNAATFVLTAVTASFCQITTSLPATGVFSWLCFQGHASASKTISITQSGVTWIYQGTKSTSGGILQLGTVGIGKQVLFRLFWQSATLCYVQQLASDEAWTDFNKLGRIQDYTGLSTVGALYARAVAVPDTNNYSILIPQDGSSIALNGSTDVKLTVGGGTKVTLNSSTLTSTVPIQIGSNGFYGDATVYAMIWGKDVASKDGTNYSFATHKDGSQTYINGSAGVQLRYGNVDRLIVSNSTVQTNVPIEAQNIKIGNSSNASYTAIYTTSTSNAPSACALLLSNNGTYNNINASTQVGINISDVNKLAITNTGVTSIVTLYTPTGTVSVSDLRAKTDIEQSPLGLDFIMALKPIKYKFIVGGTESRVVNNVTEQVDVPGKRDHYGFGAQDVEAVLDGNDFGGFVRKEDGALALRYEEFIAPMVKAIQDQQKLINELTARLDSMENSWQQE